MAGDRRGRRRTLVRDRASCPETPEEGLVWAKHCTEEIGNWGAFLPQLYALYRAVESPEHNPYADLSVVRDGDGVVRYRVAA